MSTKLKNYYYFLLGGFGGVTGWFILSYFTKINDISTNILWVYCVRGLILGAIIGISLAAYEGITNYSLVRFISYGLSGLITGGIGGAVSLPLAQFLYTVFIAKSGLIEKPNSGYLFLFGLICWVVFGGIIGFIEGIGKGTQYYKGFIGGAFGGILGGLVYETARSYGNFVNEALFTRNEYIIQSISFLLLGGLIGGFVSMITKLFASAEIEILSGLFTGMVKDISKFVKPNSKQTGSIGSSYYDIIYIKDDPEILSSHAILCYEDNEPRIKISEGAKKARKDVKVNNRPISSWALNNGDIIQIGSTRMMYRQYKNNKQKT